MKRVALPCLCPFPHRARVRASAPKMPVSLRILVTDEIDRDGVELLRAVPAFEVDELPTLPAAELLERIDQYDAIVGRSATRVTEALLRRARRLKVVGRAGGGIDNTAVDGAPQLGIP